jgi:flavin-binding protein dodecin
MTVAKVIEITASSKNGLQAAIEAGITKATGTLDDVEGAWVQDIKVKCKDGKITEWRVNMKVSFVLK